jgi:IclR family transcriptional regulator, pca regulon regulatory protein
MKVPSRPYFSEPFAKGLRIISLFGPERKTLSLKEIAESLGANKSSVYRFTNTLVELNYLKKDPQTKLLSLGQRAYLLGLSLVNSFSLLDVVRPFIDEVRERLNISIDSCVLEGEYLLQLYFRAAKDAPTYQAHIINPAIHCSGLGKAILAFLPDDERTALLGHLRLVKRTDNSITDKRVLLADLERARERGYAINNEEYIKGLITIATPFFNLESGRPVGAVSFDFLTIQESLAGVEKKYPQELLKLGKDISSVIK